MSSAEEQQLLTTISRLRKFSTDQIAARVALSPDEVERYLQSCRWVERRSVDSLAQPGKLGSAWCVHQHMAADLVSLISGFPQTDDRLTNVFEGKLEVDAQPPHDTLQIGLDLLESGRLTATQHRRELKLLRAHLHGVETDIWDQHILATRRLRDQLKVLEAARERLNTAALCDDLAAPLPKTDARRQFEAALADWTHQIKSISGEEPADASLQASASALDLATTLFKGVLEAEGEESNATFVPALRVISLHQSLAPSAWNVFRPAAVDAISRALRLPQAARLVASGSLLAVALEAPELTDAILRVLLDAAAGIYLDGEDRSVALSCLARLAQGSAEQGVNNIPAAACLLLLSRLSSEIDLPILAPAAICCPEADIEHVFCRIAFAMFDEGGLKPKLANRIEMGPFCRTLACALFLRQNADVGKVLQRALADARGSALVKSLFDDSHAAMYLIDGNAGAYHLYAGSKVREVVDPQQGVRIDVAGDGEESVLRMLRDVGEWGKGHGGPTPFTGRFGKWSKSGRLHA